MGQGRGRGRRGAAQGLARSSPARGLARRGRRAEAPAPPPVLRRALDALYRLSGALAALFLVAICAIVLLQVGANCIDKIAEWTTGAPIGLVVPSYAEFAGFFLAASSFLALAWTLRHGGHIRVSLFVRPRWPAGRGARSSSGARASRRCSQAISPISPSVS